MITQDKDLRIKSLESWVVSIIERMVELRLRWFRHVWRRAIVALKRSVDKVKDNSIVKDLELLVCDWI